MAADVEPSADGGASACGTEGERGERSEGWGRHRRGAGVAHEAQRWGAAGLGGGEGRRHWYVCLTGPDTCRCAPARAHRPREEPSSTACAEDA